MGCRGLGVRLLCVLAFSACPTLAAGVKETPTPLPSLPASLAVPTALTVSGVSSGAFFALQVAVAHSCDIAGVGIIAGGPYWCAKGLMEVALTACMSDPSLILVSELVDYTKLVEATGGIDTTKCLAGRRAWLFSGTKDTVVDQRVGLAAVDYLNKVSDNSVNISTVLSTPAEHSWPTSNYGNACDYLGTPYINDCDLDASGLMLAHLLGKPARTRSRLELSNNRTGRLAGNGTLYSFSQKEFAPSPRSIREIGMGEIGMVYIPAQCANATTDKCRLHVVFHGCEQTFDQVGDVVGSHIGMNEVADELSLIVLYPQAAATDIPYNPKGCWDWWGYVDRDYATKNGAQTQAVWNMVQHLVQGDQ